MQCRDSYDKWSISMVMGQYGPFYSVSTWINIFIKVWATPTSDSSINHHQAWVFFPLTVFHYFLALIDPYRVWMRQDFTGSWNCNSHFPSFPFLMKTFHLPSYLISTTTFPRPWHDFPFCAYSIFCDRTTLFCKLGSAEPSSTPMAQLKSQGRGITLPLAVQTIVIIIAWVAIKRSTLSIWQQC